MFCTYPDGSLYSGPVWAGESHFADYTCPRVRNWWGALYQDMVELGVDGFWNDMNEPTVFGHSGDTFPDSVQHDWEGQGSDHRLAHNVYGMQMARATAKGLMKLRPNERPLVITRSLWAGTQRYNMHWLGDNRSDWAGMYNAIQLMLTMGLSGIAFTGPDTGGFEGTPSSELLIRWNQVGIFSPFFRNHTAKNTKDQEPWAFGVRCETLIRKAIELRYHLLPYHYTTAWQSCQSGLPMIRPLVLAFQNDRHVTQIDDQFMFGDALLVAPVLKAERTSRRVYIPEGKWYDFWSGALTAGPQIARLDAPLERIPLLVRAGSVIPAWPVMQFTHEHPIDALILHVYPGNGKNWLYEDDGHTWAFTQGEARITCFTCHLEQSTEDAPPTLKIERTVKGTFTPQYDRVQVILHGLRDAPQSTSVDDQLVEMYSFDKSTHTWTLEANLFETLKVTLGTPPPERPFFLL
jgi:alpha-glucosidase